MAVIVSCSGKSMGVPFAVSTTIGEFKHAARMAGASLFSQLLCKGHVCQDAELVSDLVGRSEGFFSQYSSMNLKKL